MFFKTLICQILQ